MSPRAALTPRLPSRLPSCQDARHAVFSTPAMLGYAQLLGVDLGSSVGLRDTSQAAEQKEAGYANHGGGDESREVAA